MRTELGVAGCAQGHIPWPEPSALPALCVRLLVPSRELPAELQGPCLRHGMIAGVLLPWPPPADTRLLRGLAAVQPELPVLPDLHHVLP